MTNSQISNSENLSKIQIPQNTFLQKLLGQNYKWWFLLKHSFKSISTGIFGFLISQVSDIVQVLGITYIWILNNSTKEVITYLIIGRIFKSLSDCYVAEVVAPEVSSGKITNYLLLPSSFIPIYFCREIGRRFVFNTGRVASLLVAIIIFFSYIDLKIFKFNKSYFTFTFSCY